MAKLSYEQLKAVITQYVVQNSLCSDNLDITRNNIVGLADKIGKITSLDTEYIDKLQYMDSDVLQFGKTVEEWSIDLSLAQDYDPSGANTLAPNYATFRPAQYSKELGRKFVKTTIPYGNIERGVNNEGELIAITALIMKRLEDSHAAYKYAVKREMVGALCEMCDNAMNTTTTFTASATYAVNTYLKESSTSNVRGVVVKPYKNSASNWAEAVSNGFIIVLDLITKIAKPTDTATGEAFIKAIKNDVETASDLSEGHSLNGNSLGATSGLKLLLTQKIKSVMEVDVQAGAFQADKVAVPAEEITIKDFGSANSSFFAVLLDSRAIRLYNAYNAVREQPNGEGDFINYFRHFDYTGQISKNAFVRIYKAE